MIIDAKQLSPNFEAWYKEFMETRFPVITKLEPVWQSGAYTHTTDDQGRTVINMDKGVALTVSKLPSKATATYKNKGKEDISLFWDNEAAGYNPNKSGEQVIHAGIPSGIYNPLKLSPELIMMIARSEKLSLANWWANGAKVKDVSYKDKTTAEDFAELSDYYITAVNSAFLNAESIVSLPDLATEKPDSLTSFEKTFSGCKNLETVPSVSTVAVTSFIDAFKDCEKVTDLSHISMKSTQYVTGMFNGCKSLKKLPDMSEWTNAPSSFTNMFKNCSSLPAVMTEVLNLSGVPKAVGLTGMFSGSSVKEITVKYTGETIPEFIAPIFFGGALEKITIVDAAGEVREVRTPANNPTELKYLEAGESKITIPAGVTKAKVALVSGVTYSQEQRDVKYVKATNNISAILDADGNEIITSNKEATDRSIYYSYTSSQEQHGGNPAMFDAPYEVYDQGEVYCCGVGSGYQATKYVHAWGALSNTFVQGEIDVVPGAEYTIKVGNGSVPSSGTWNKKPGNGHYNGYVLVQFM